MYEVYIDEYNFRYYVSDEFGDLKSFLTWKSKTNTPGMEIVRSEHLPPRATRAEAQRDLDAWAKELGLKLVKNKGA